MTSVCHMIKTILIVFSTITLVGCETKSPSEIVSDSRSALFDIYGTRRAFTFYYGGPSEFDKEIFNFVQALGGSIVNNRRSAEFLFTVDPNIGPTGYYSSKNPRCLQTEPFWVELKDAKITDRNTASTVLIGQYYYTPCKGILPGNVRTALSFIRPSRNF